MKRFIFLLVALLVATTPAFAIDIQNFYSAIGSNNLFSLYTTDPLEKWQFSMGLNTNIAGDPLTFTKGDNEFTVVNQMIGNQFYVSFGIMGYVDIGLSTSYDYVAGDLGDAGMNIDTRLPNHGDDLSNYDQDNPKHRTATGVGDVRLMVKGQFWENKPKQAGLGAVVFAHFPSGDPDYFNGAGAIDVGGLFLVDKRFSGVNLVFNAGYKYKGASTGENPECDGEYLNGDNDLARCRDESEIVPSYLSEILFGVGMSVYAHRIVDVIAEINGKTQDYGLEGIAMEIPIEARVGAKLYTNVGLAFLLAAGGQVNGGIGSPTYRINAGVEFTYPKQDRSSPWKTPVSGPVVDPNSKTDDTDRDGLTNYDESNTFGTDFMNPDSDGDNLKDGDEVNKYKTDPTKKDTDGDGLTDGNEINNLSTNPLLTDTDSDTLPDGVEVNELGTKPTSNDTDGDKITDNLDGAPLQAETINGYQDTDGVPEVTLAKRPSGVVMFENLIWLPEKIVWRGKRNDKVDKNSRPLLDDIVVILTEYPDTNIQIECHVPRGGNEPKNKVMTLRRAKSIKKYLVSKGISKDRLTAIGSGSDFPISSNASPEGREKNRRTEFVIIAK